MIRTDRQQVAADDGHPIAVSNWSGGATVRAVIQIAHGLGEHALRYQWLAERLVAAGFVVYANDHRGHGSLAAAANALGEFGDGGFGSLISDMAVVSRLAAHEYPGRPLFLLGHSMGSYAAQWYALEYSDQLSGMILSGCAALDARLAELGPGGLRASRPNAAFDPARTPWDWLSRDPDAVDAFIADRLCGHPLSAASAASLEAAAPRLCDPAALAGLRRDLPLLLLSGDRDPVTGFLAHFERLCDRYRDAGLSDVSAFVYGGARHELFNEINRGEVASNVRAWIDRILLS